MDFSDENHDIAAAMGFSSFAEVNKSKKRKPAGSDIDEAEGSNEFQSADSNPFSPTYGSMPPSERNLCAGRQGQSTGANAMPLGQPRQMSNRENTKNSKTNITLSDAHPVLQKKLEELTKDDLFALKKGVSDGKGRTTFFQKSFIEDKPWKDFERLKEATQGE